MSGRDWLIEYMKRPADINQHLLYMYDKCVELGIKRMLEIGVRAAITTRAFLLAMEKTEGHLTSIDMVRYSSEFPGSIFKKIANSRWTFILDRSSNVRLEEKFDALFIDSDHSFIGVIGDLWKFAPLTKKIIFLHDTFPGVGVKNTEVMRAIEEFIKANPKWTFHNMAFNNGLGTLQRCDE